MLMEDWKSFSSLNKPYYFDHFSRSKRLQVLSLEYLLEIFVSYVKVIGGVMFH